MRQLFCVILSEASSWIGDRLHKVVCERCGEPRQKTITNVTHNYFYCPRCGNRLDQYVNVTPHTINRDNTVASAGIGEVHYHSLSREALKLSNALDTLNIKDQPVVVEGRFGGWRPHPFFATRTAPLYPTPQQPRWANHWTVPIRAIPLRDFRIGVDFVVYNAWEEPLAIHRGGIDSIDLFAELIRLEIRRQNPDSARLALEFMRRDPQPRDARYRRLVLDLAERLLRG